jgi:hypothetical protein
MSQEDEPQLIWQEEELKEAFRKLDSLGAFTGHDRGQGILDKRLHLDNIPIIAGLVYYSPEFFYEDGPAVLPRVPFPEETRVRYDIGESGKVRIHETPLDLVFYPEDELGFSGSLLFKVHFKNGFLALGSVVFNKDGDIGDQQSIEENKGRLIVPNNSSLLVPTYVSGRIIRF